MAKVPFNVFEVKLAGVDGMPPGLSTLISEGVIEETPKFSKFLTGAATFNRVSTLPYWAKHPSFGPMFGLDRKQSKDSSGDYSSPLDDMCYHLMSPFSSSSPNEGSSSSNSDKSTLARSLQKLKGAVGAGKTVNIAEKKPVRVEPKSFFANERTFIQWISAGLLLLTVSTIMMGNGEYFRTSALISLSALILVGYATFVYFRRIRLLTSGKGYGYVDHVGPVLLAAGVGIGVFIVFVDVIRASEMFNWGFADRRSLLVDSSSYSSSGVRRLGISSLPTMYEEPGKCFQHSLTGLNSLKYQPKDAIIDEGTNALLVASTQEIVSHPLLQDEGNKPVTLLKIPNTELGGLTSVGDRIFALSGGPERTELIELAWAWRGGMEVTARWTIHESPSQTEGLTFVPDIMTTTTTTKDEPHGQLYMDVNGMIHSYQVPRRGDDAKNSHLIRLDSINMKLIHRHQQDDDDKIASMHYFEGVTYILHSNRKVLHAWDMETGEFLVEIPLPRLENNNISSNDNQWTGITLERRRRRRFVEPKDSSSSSLRGSYADSSADADDDDSSTLLLHLTSDAPPQIWTFAIKEDQSSSSSSSSRGRLTFPDCAAAVHSAMN